MEHLESLIKKRKYNEAKEFQQMAEEDPEKIPGAHVMKMNLPKGSKAAFIDRTGDGRRDADVEQREVLLDKDSMFQISDIRKMDDVDSYELVLDLLSEKEGKKRKKKK